MSKLHKIVATLAESQHNFHKAMVETPDDAETHHQKAMDECAKAMSDCAKAEVADELAKRDAQQVVPTAISAIAPPRAIPRTGQPSPAAAGSFDLLHPDFQKLIAPVDSEENMQGD
jgi:hypothetical protein